MKTEGTNGSNERAGRVPFVEFFSDSTRCGTKIAQGHYCDTGRYPIVDQGDNEIAGFTDCDEGLFKDVPVVIFGDHTRIVKYVDQPFFLGADGVKILTPCKDVFCKFAFYALNAARIESLGYSRHFKLVKELQFPLPPLAEQKRIAEELDNICAAKKDAEAIVEKLKLLAKSLFVEMFGDFKSNSKKWPIAPFDDVAKIESGLVKDFQKYANYPHIGIDSITKDTGELVGFRTVAQDSVKSGKYLFTPEHIIYSKIRPNLNKVALPNFEGLCSADSYAILPKVNTNRVFLAYVLRSQYFLDYIVPLSGRSGMPKANQEQVRGFRMPLPPLALQQKFAAFIEQLDKSRFEAQALIGKLDLLYRAKLQEYFG
ncbi:MAG: restriction endonuclease subunit S [bacterium]|nr:restriction endonuclease subunit S [bacterium]